MIGQNDHFQAALAGECFVDLWKRRVVGNGNGLGEAWAASVVRSSPGQDVGGRRRRGNSDQVDLRDRRTARLAPHCGAAQRASQAALTSRSSTKGNGSMMSCAITSANGLPAVSSFCQLDSSLAKACCSMAQSPPDCLAIANVSCPCSKSCSALTPTCHGTIAVVSDSRFVRIAIRLGDTKSLGNLLSDDAGRSRRSTRQHDLEDSVVDVSRQCIVARALLNRRRQRRE